MSIYLVIKIKLVAIIAIFFEIISTPVYYRNDMPSPDVIPHIGKPITGNAGKVTFQPAPDGRGTIVTLELDYIQFEGALGISLGKIFAHVPERQVLETLHHFKELMETGEIPFETLKQAHTKKPRRMERSRDFSPFSWVS